MAQNPGNSKYGKQRRQFDYDKAYTDAGNLDIKALRKDLEEEQPEDQIPKKLRKKQAQKKKKLRSTIIAIAAICVVAAGIITAILLVRAGRAQISDEDTEAAIIPRAAHVQVEELYIYGTHMNMSGVLPSEIIDFEGSYGLDLVLESEEDLLAFPITTEGSGFKLSEDVNGGIYLDAVPRAVYKMYIRMTSYSPFETESTEVTSQASSESQKPGSQRAENEGEETTVRRIERKKPPETTTEETLEEGESVTEDPNREEYFRYYALDNVSAWPETVYYTMSSYDNRIVIDTDSESQTLRMNVSENTEDGIYDVVIDPGNGGSDQGAVGLDGYSEKSFNLPLSLKIKALLEKKGLKVALTRESDSTTLTPYGAEGRIARACSKHAKYMVSIHMNGGGTGGLEIYTASGIDYTFAQLLADNIKEKTGLSDSSSPTGKVLTDIYSKNFTQADVDDTIAQNKADGLVPYEPTTRSSYYFIIRETGGVATGAYKDDRNPSESFNPYAGSNVGLETYVLRLGYVDVREDLKIMIEHMDDHAQAIADSIMSVYGEAPKVSAETEGEDKETESRQTEAESQETESAGETGSG